MSESNTGAEPSTGDPAPQRDDVDDHDLLTYGEAGARLYEEIAAQRAIIAALASPGRPGDVDDPNLDAARGRLQLLEEAAERNFRGTITADNFERFFGYRGTPKRNT